MSLKEKIAENLKDWYNEPNWLEGDLPILASQILDLIEQEAKEKGWHWVIGNVCDRNLACCGLAFQCVNPQDCHDYTPRQIFQPVTRQDLEALS